MMEMMQINAYTVCGGISGLLGGCTLATKVAHGTVYSSE